MANTPGSSTDYADLFRQIDEAADKSALRPEELSHIERIKESGVQPVHQMWIQNAWNRMFMPKTNVPKPSRDQT